MSAENISRRSVLGVGIGLGLGFVAGGVLSGCAANKAPLVRTASGGVMKLPSYTAPRSLPGAFISHVDGVGPRTSPTLFRPSNPC
jgi:hypothetical protein